MSSNQIVNKRLLYPLLCGFMISGFSDILSPITGYISRSLSPEEVSIASFIPTLAFLWFLLLSIPFATIMARVGRKAMMMTGILLSLVGLMIPFVAGDNPQLLYYFIGFGLVGIGNTSIQVSINPMISSITPLHQLTSYLTLGQVFRNTPLLLLSPLMLMFAHHMGSWRFILPAYAILALISLLWMGGTKYEEQPSSALAPRLSECLSLLKTPTIAICVVGIGAFIAADIGIGYLSGQMMPSDNSILLIAGYYMFRIVGTLIGAYVMSRYSDVRFMRVLMIVCLLLAIACIAVNNPIVLYILVGLMGFSISCVFATLFSVASRTMPSRINEISGLMIMTISSGAITVPIVAYIIKCTGQPHYGMFYVAAAVSYLVWASFKLPTNINKQN